ncbi:hypothetical protein [Agrobacterium sp. El2ro-1b]|uniref:hypothetical protein n=1 Tax=Agrobacterium sp. El2ro-1b TaxID=2969528 RepID=UPI003AAB2A07
MVALVNFARLRIVIFSTVKISRCFQTVERVLSAGYGEKRARPHSAGHDDRRDAAAGGFFSEK